MPNIENAKKNKIKPEDVCKAEVAVIKCKYAGQSQVGIGPVAKTTDFYKIIVQLPGTEKPIKIKVKEKQGWGAGVAQDIKSMGKMFGKNKPVNEGDIINVVYDINKPKKCYLADEQPQPEQQP